MQEFIENIHIESTTEFAESGFAIRVDHAALGSSLEPLKDDGTLCAAHESSLRDLDKEAYYHARGQLICWLQDNASVSVAVNGAADFFVIDIPVDADVEAIRALIEAEQLRIGGSRACPLFGGGHSIRVYRNGVEIRELTRKATAPAGDQRTLCEEALRLDDLHGVWHRVNFDDGVDIQLAAAVGRRLCMRDDDGCHLVDLRRANGGGYRVIWHDISGAYQEAEYLPSVDEDARLFAWAMKNPVAAVISAIEEKLASRKPPEASQNFRRLENIGEYGTPGGNGSNRSSRK